MAAECPLATPAPKARREILARMQGLPWLVNALASPLTASYDALVPERGVHVTAEKVLDAREIPVERRDTPLNRLVDKLREYQRGVRDCHAGGPVARPALLSTRETGKLTQ